MQVLLADLALSRHELVDIRARLAAERAGRAVDERNDTLVARLLPRQSEVLRRDELERRNLRVGRINTGNRGRRPERLPWLSLGRLGTIRPSGRNWLQKANRSPFDGLAASDGTPAAALHVIAHTATSLAARAERLCTCTWTRVRAMPGRLVPWSRSASKSTWVGDGASGSVWKCGARGEANGTRRASVLMSGDW